jgi:hypothetical protein
MSVPTFLGRTVADSHIVDFLILFRYLVGLLLDESVAKSSTYTDPSQSPLPIQACRKVLYLFRPVAKSST